MSDSQEDRDAADLPQDERAGADSSEEDAELIAQLVHELETNPPLACPYSYTGPGDETRVRQAMGVLHLQAALMRRRHPWLNFDALESMVFHSDFVQALRDLSERAGRELHPTTESTGAGVAMVVKLGNKSVLVAEANILLGMTSENEARRDICIDTALHELCHVYDDERFGRLLADDLRRGTTRPMQGHVFTAAHAAWSEYFANRYSDSGYSSPDEQPKFLAEVVPSVVNDVHSAIQVHIAQPDLPVVLALCRKKVNYLFQCFGYAAGRLSANGAVLEEVAAESVAALEVAGLYTVFLRVHLGLDALNEERDSWTSFDDLQPLMDQADSTFRALGLHYSLDSRGVRVQFG